MSLPLLDRRGFLATSCALPFAAACLAENPPTAVGQVEGQPQANKVGMQVLKDGGNAVDAIVAAAITAAVVAPQMCGPGGYGGAFVAAIDGGKRIVGVDFNSTAPMTATADMFKPDAKGNVPGQIDMYGWKASGVPGTLAGLQHIAKKYGKKSLSDLFRPAAEIVKEGLKADGGLVAGIRSSLKHFQADPAAAAVYLPGGEVPKPGDRLPNPDLAKLLETFVKAGNVDDFYKGDTAKQIAKAFQARGGLVTVEDLARYQPLDVELATQAFGNTVVHTPPPASGGLTVLQMLAVLDQVGWAAWDNDPVKLLRGRLETMRLCWGDRLRKMGDPAALKWQWRELLDSNKIRQDAKRVRDSVESGRPLEVSTDGRTANGTIHLSTRDAQGNYAAMTLTHGGYFGARIMVPGTGVVFGHGMSRFDPHPGSANCPGPGKRPLHNMCPSIVTRDQKAILALGARGGRKIPNAVFEVLAQAVLLKQSPAKALAAPRLHTEGGMKVELEAGWTPDSRKTLESQGYQVTQSAHATVSAVWADGGGIR